MQSIFSAYNGIKVESNNRGKLGKFTKTWKFKNTLLNNLCVKEEITRKLESIFRENENKNATYQKSWKTVNQCKEGNL